MKTSKLFTALMLLSGLLKAQTVDHSYKPMTLKLDEKGTKFIRFITWHQVWTSYTENNPGTLDINGKVQKSSMDFGIRRSRVLIQAQVSPRFMLVTHFGINNQSFSNGGSAGALGTGASSSGQGGKRPQLYIHDAWTEYAILPGKLHMGAGLHYWNGVSRMASNSTLNFMTLDAPIHNWFNIEATDQFARQLGIYAKGQLGKFDYRIALNKPFAFGVPNNSAISSPNAVNVLTETWASAGYFNYQFFDKESNVLPFFTGTYLGAKKVLNAGVGYYYHPKVTASRPSTKDSVVTHDQKNLGADIYLDMPLKGTKGMALNVYSSYTMHDFGPNYLRNLGILNQHLAAQTTAQNSDASWAGGGNAQPTIGTGTVWYTQAGLLLPKLSNGTAFMPYATFTYKNFDRLGKASGQFDLGMNYFINGHNAKLTLQYGSRPVYKTVAGSSTPVQNGSKGEVVLQTHIFL
ncbi:MAG TPA: hypothetical protein PLU10_08980 [Chitinophagaceae bacterium]|nr:hypothetical protein [Chitinophagaceae bacterium]